MAEIAETPQFSFSIEETLHGDRTIINDIFGEETSTASPDSITKIEKPVKEKETTKKVEETKVVEEKKEEPSNQIEDLLGTEEGEEASGESKQKPVKKEKTTDEQETNPEIFESLSKELFKLNVFTKGEEEADVEIKTPEEFLERFNFEKEKGANQKIESFLSQFGEDYQNAFQAIYVEGVHPKEYFQTYNNIENIAELDLAIESNQESIVKQFYQDIGSEDEDIRTTIEKLKSYGDLQTESQKLQKILVKKEAQKLQQLTEQKEKQNQQTQSIKKQYAQNVNSVLQDKLKVKEFDGIPLNPKLAQELQEFLVVDKYKTPSGETLTEFDKTILDLKRPENHNLKVKIGLILKVLEKDPTLSTIQKAGITKKSDQLFGDLAKKEVKTGVKSSKEETPKSWFS